jgi:hypothetical protein
LRSSEISKKGFPSEGHLISKGFEVFFQPLMVISEEGLSINSQNQQR